MSVMKEHYEMADGFKGPEGPENTGRGGGGGGEEEKNGSEEMGMYEVVSPIESPTLSDPKEPKVVARRASQKSKSSLQSSRDRSSLIAYQDDAVESEGVMGGAGESEGAEGGAGKVVGMVQLAPAPDPQRWTKPRVRERREDSSGGDSSRHGSEESDKDAVWETTEAQEAREHQMEDEDFYSIPPDAVDTPDPDTPSEAPATVVEAQVLEGALEQAGYETWRTFSPTDKEDKSISDQLQEVAAAAEAEGSTLPDVMEDGRQSNSSLVRECLAEFDYLCSKSPLVMVDVDQMQMAGGEGGDRGGKEEEGGDRGGKEEERGESPTHTYENQEMIAQREGERERDGETSTAPQTAEIGGDDPEKPESAVNSQENEDLSQYDLQTVRHPPIVTDSRGYCEVEVNPGNDDNDLINYDLQTVSHPPVPTSTEGYSYCDVGGLRTSSKWQPTGKDPPPSAAAPASSSGSQPPLGSSDPLGYSEIDVLTTPTQTSPPRPSPGDNRPPAPVPRPRRRDESTAHNSSKVSNNTPLPSNDTPTVAPPDNRNGVRKSQEAKDTLPEPKLEEDVDADFSDDDALYARVIDIKSRKEATRKEAALKKPSPKAKRKKKPGEGKASPKNSPKIKRKARAPPSRRPPPPPPPVALGKLPTAPLPQTPEGPSTPSSAPPLAPEQKGSPRSEREHRFEQSLPPLPARLPGSPAHRANIAGKVTDLMASLGGSVIPSLPGAGSPKLPGRKGPLPPSPLQSDPPSPSQRRRIFNRGKSQSVRNRKSEHTTLCSPLAEDVGRVVDKRGEQSPKLKWKPKFRFRRGSGPSASSENGATGGEEGGAGGGGGGGGDGGGVGEVSGNSVRRRRNREDKLPDVPDLVKSRSLPSPSRQVGLGKDMHVHMPVYDGEEEEDDLYSVVSKPQKPQPKKEEVNPDTVHVHSTCIFHTLLFTCMQLHTLHTM